MFGLIRERSCLRDLQQQMDRMLIPFRPLLSDLDNIDNTLREEYLWYIDEARRLREKALACHALFLKIFQIHGFFSCLFFKKDRALFEKDAAELMKSFEHFFQNIHHFSMLTVYVLEQLKDLQEIPDYAEEHPDAFQTLAKKFGTALSWLVSHLSFSFIGYFFKTPEKGKTPKRKTPSRQEQHFFPGLIEYFEWVDTYHIYDKKAPIYTPPNSCSSPKAETLSCAKKELFQLSKDKFGHAALKYSALQFAWDEENEVCEMLLKQAQQGYIPARIMLFEEYLKYLKSLSHQADEIKHVTFFNDLNRNDEIVQMFASTLRLQERSSTGLLDKLNEDIKTIKTTIQEAENEVSRTENILSTIRSNWTELFQQQMTLIFEVSEPSQRLAWKQLFKTDKSLFFKKLTDHLGHENFSQDEVSQYIGNYFLKMTALRDVSTQRNLLNQLSGVSNRIETIKKEIEEREKASLQADSQIISDRTQGASKGVFQSILDTKIPGPCPLTQEQRETIRTS